MTRLTLLGLLALTACADAPDLAGLPEVDPDPPAEATPTVQQARYPARAADGLAEIHFTRPGTERDGHEDPEADDAIIAAIDSAEASVDLCLYEFNRTPIVEAAERAAMRGVLVRFVGDGDELHDPGYEALQALGVELVLRKPLDRIMHNKFAVVDARRVVTGSMNFSENGVLRNNNNVLRFESADLADVYATEFQQMFDSGLFGRNKASLQIDQQVEVGPSPVEVYFSPQDDPVQALRRLLSTADVRVFFMIFSFTHDDVRADLEALHAAGVEVVGVFDESQARGRYSVDEAMAAAGVPVYIDGNHNAIGFAGGKLHHKVMIIDAGTDSDPMVISGSFNWSNSATRYNDENLIVLRGRDFTTPYLEEFCRVLEVATLHEAYLLDAPDPCASLLVSVRINEALPNPEGTDAGKEFVELVNGGAAPMSLEGWTLGDAQKPARHVFGDRVLDPGASLVIWDAADEADPRRIVASSGGLGLTNTTDTLTLRDAAGVVVDKVTWTAAPSGQSFNRAPDGSAESEFVLHGELSAEPMSPGRRVDGSLWPGEPRLVINEVLPNPEGTDTGKEYVELINAGTGAVSLRGWTLADQQRVRHVFDGVVLQPGEVAVLFDQGVHDDVPGALLSSTGTLSLNNTGETLTLTDARGNVHAITAFGPADSGIALNREVDGDGDSPLVAHDTVAATALSPGYRADGSHWIEPPPLLKVVINELLPDPEGTDTDQEYVELVNVGEGQVNLAGWSLGDAVSDDRHVFGGGEVLEVGEAVVIFDGGAHPEVPGARIASSGGLSLNNGGDAITLYRADGSAMDGVVYDASLPGVALNRAVDGDPFAELVSHSAAEGADRAQSPGTRVDGAAW